MDKQCVVTYQIHIVQDVSILWMNSMIVQCQHNCVQEYQQHNHHIERRMRDDITHALPCLSPIGFHM